jgi:hypothetical protein
MESHSLRATRATIQGFFSSGPHSTSPVTNISKRESDFLFGSGFSRRPVNSNVASFKRIEKKTDISRPSYMFFYAKNRELSFLI